MKQAEPGGSDAMRGLCSELRCDCGSLLARAIPGGVELKCRRCKRTIALQFSADGLRQGREQPKKD